MKQSIESEAREMGFTPEAAALLGRSDAATRTLKEVEQRTRDARWAEAEQAAKTFYAGSGAPNREQKEYAYAMGYYHALKKA